MAEPPDGVPGRVLYHLHSLGAAGVPAANPDPGAAEPSGHGLHRLERWLDHVRWLGCGGVLLTPICVSASHGYDTVDPFRIDQRLGDEGDFAAFAAACHERDLLLLLDGVFNHVGRAFPAFRDVLARGAASPYAPWFHLDFATGGPDGFAYADFEGHPELVALNHGNPEVLGWASAVCRHWLDRGADGWRLDVAYLIPETFLASLSQSVRGAHPGTFLFGEKVHGDYARFVAESRLDGVTQYELYKAIWSSLNDANLFELAWALKRHREFSAAFTPVTFLGNHDVTRLATQLRDPALLGPAIAVLLTVPGVPCVYYGDELAWQGRREDGPGGDDAVRQPLPPSPEPADAAQAAALRLHRELIAVRRDRPWLTRAELEVGEVSNPGLTYTVTGPEPGQRLRVSLDLSGNAITPPPGWRPIAEGRGWSAQAP
jgi:cyclomaltodextrinase